ncbi:MAG: TIGR01777 family oxidoreductase [Acidovorax sp.]|jgi:uncharacterized protein (TIGR01777 family)|uniref:TIGR01777 family oxidoreductase n=1 Tax=Acidovorax sp. 106 TaxID=2135637 RepID=UPI000F2D2DCE|nr:TIGR01777 family oxidoreductase [Acidovorax sp. 106]MCZ8092999.1 TIGR01777 family oxidoreductase [Acidovorax sp.]RLJ37334.1 uncharacterized protein (TIGR01777 family) [Acidovorax sp. 106]
MQVLITGGTGFIGQALVQRLIAAGHAVTVCSRNPTQAARQLGAGVRCVSTLNAIAATDRIDAIVNLAGARVVGPPWTAARRQVLLNSRIGTTQALLQWLQQTGQRPSVWVQASAIGFYGVRPPEEILTETSTPGQGFMSELCVRWEQAAAQATAQGIRQVVLRLGVVLGPGGALPPLLLPIRLGLGGRMGSGQQVMSWIHRDDVLTLITTALQSPQNSPPMQGIYNATAPEPVPQATFAATAGQLLHRPVWLPVPAAPLRWAMGEMAQLFVDGQNVLPARLQREGFTFAHPTLRQALRSLV